MTLPASITLTMGFTKSEAVEWTATDKHHFVLSRSLAVSVMPATGRFSHVLRALEVNLPPPPPLVVAVDDTLVRKTGCKIDRVGWKRDTLGPAFQTNLVRGQRYVPSVGELNCGFQV